MASAIETFSHDLSSIGVRIAGRADDLFWRPMTEPWHPGETPEEQAARREAYQRLVDAAHRIGVPLQHLRDGLRQVAHSETETRRFLAEDVYGVPDDLLDDMVRIRFAELDESG